MRDIQITCSNGESMPGIGYLIYAGIALGDAINFDEAFFIQALTLKKLKKIAEYKIEKYEPRDRKYYENPENIKKDLETYAFLGNGYGRTSFDEWIIYRTYADCTNGEVVRGHTWICNGAVALGYAKNYREAASNGARNLNRIEEIAKSIEVTN